MNNYRIMITRCMALAFIFMSMPISAPADPARKAGKRQPQSGYGFSRF